MRLVTVQRVEGSEVSGHGVFQRRDVKKGGMRSGSVGQMGKKGHVGGAPRKRCGMPAPAGAALTGLLHT